MIVWLFYFTITDMIPTYLFVIYLFGMLASYAMVKIDHNASGMDYTIGMKMINIILSLFSWLMVLTILVVSWIKYIGRTGYWHKTVK